jgi:hypothetical protein
MAEQATASTETKQKATGNGAAPTTGRGYKTISKVEAVRRSIEKLGRGASNAEIQADVLERFGVEMSTNHVSTCKGDLARKTKTKKPVAAPSAKVQPAKPAARREQATPSATTSHSGTSDGKGPAIPLEDILTVKGLVDRVGAGHLRTLIDVMAK